MIRRAMSDPIGWVLVLVGVAVSAVAIAGIGTVTSAEACLEQSQRLLTLCDSGPDRLLVLVESLLACAAWCLVGMRAARRPR